VERPEQEASGTLGPLGGGRGKVRSERGNNGVGGNRFKTAVSAEND